MHNIIEITDGTPRHPLFRMKKPVNLTMKAGQQIAIAGDNAAGKSRLIDIITGKYPLLLNEVRYDFAPSTLKLTSENIKYITFRDSYGDSDTTYYYQQRWNQHDIEEDTPTAGALLEEAFAAIEKNTGYGLTEEEREQASQKRRQLKEKLYEIFSLSSLLDKYIITLSSGELRKFQLTKALISGPRVLILDNPFVGLDVQTRRQLSDLLRTLIAETDLLVVPVLSKTEDIPDFITHVIPVEGLDVLPIVTRSAYLAARQPLSTRLTEEQRACILGLPEKPAAGVETGDTILKFCNVGIRYGRRTILKDLNWTVRRGEKWALSGENGAGKSTLLSLVCADNPQSYACHIELFGRKRGSGESIWEIKRHIGYVSPEMHRAYLKDLPAIDIVASGLNDSVGLYVRPGADQRSVCEMWMSLFGIAHLKDRTFLRLSSGEQRLCLLARAFVKDPELLILDEPMHGLDDRNRQLAGEIISAFCRRNDKTLIMVTHYEEELPDIITHKLFLKKNS